MTWSGEGAILVSQTKTQRKESEMTQKELSEAMITYRAKHRLSQGRLAELCGLSTQTIYAVENMIQSPSAVTREKIRLVVCAE